MTDYHKTAIDPVPETGELGVKCSEKIMQDPDNYINAAEWLRNLSDEIGPVGGADDEYSIEFFELCRLEYYDPEMHKPTGRNQQIGPVAARIFNAWRYFRLKYHDKPGDTQQFVAFPEEDLRRIILLAALIWNHNWNFKRVGLKWPLGVDPSDYSGWCMEGIEPGRHLIETEDREHRQLRKLCERALQESAGCVDYTPQPKTKIGGNGMPWQKAKNRAESHVRAHDGMFPGVKALAKIVGCSRPTMDKAIKNSKYLRARRAVSKARRQGHTVPLTDSAANEASIRQYRDTPNWNH